MTNNQLHGKKFEDFIKACGMFSGASDSSRSVTAGFDIEARFDRSGLNLPTSIKASGSDGIGLSDARRFFAINEPYRMIVGRYDQSKDQKIFARIHECVITPSVSSALRGSVTLQMVSDLHQGLLLDQFPRGEHLAARAWAQAKKSQISDLETKIVLNPKIDSKSQRRLQCSVNLKDLIASCKAKGQYILHDKAIGDFALPVIQNSKRRTFQSAAASD